MPTAGWDGWFTFAKGIETLHVKNADLLIVDGQILGRGEDERGDFTIKGSYTETNNQVTFERRYTDSCIKPDRCSGTCNDHNIRGSWTGPSGEGTFSLSREFTKEDLADRCVSAVFKARSALKKQGYTTTAKIIVDAELVQCFNAASDQIRDTSGGISNIITAVHGTCVNAVEAVCQLGLTWKWANKCGMYGRGEYFVTPPEGLPKALFFGQGALFVCLLELGHPLHVSTLAGGPDGDGWWDDGSSPIDKSEYNSVVGEANTGYGSSEELNSIKEFVVYNDAQSVPMAVIYYSDEGSSESLGRFAVGDHVQTKYNKVRGQHGHWRHGTVKEVMSEDGRVLIEYENGDVETADALRVLLADVEATSAGRAAPGSDASMTSHLKSCDQGKGSIFHSKHPADVALLDRVYTPNIFRWKSAGGVDVDKQPSSFEIRCAARLREHEERIRTKSLSELKRSLVTDLFPQRTGLDSVHSQPRNYARPSSASSWSSRHRDPIEQRFSDYRSMYRQLEEWNMTTIQRPDWTAVGEFQVSFRGGGVLQ